MLNPNSIQHSEIHRIMTPAINQISNAAAGFPTPVTTLLGRVKIPLAMVRFMMRQNTVKGLRSSFLFGVAFSRLGAG